MIYIILAIIVCTCIILYYASMHTMVWLYKLEAHEAKKRTQNAEVRLETMRKRRNALAMELIKLRNFKHKFEALVKLTDKKNSSRT